MRLAMRDGSLKTVGLGARQLAIRCCAEKLHALDAMLLLQRKLTRLKSRRSLSVRGCKVLTLGA
jgi:hypothetical protein